MALTDGCEVPSSPRELNTYRCSLTLIIRTLKLPQLAGQGGVETGEGDGPNEEKECIKCVIHAEEIEN